MTLRPTPATSGVLIACLVLAVPAWSSSPLPSPQNEDPLRVPAQRDASLDAFEGWRAEHGGGWALDLDPHTGLAGFLGGGRFLADRVPMNDADFDALARRAIIASSELTGLDESTLSFERAKFLPLGMIGSTDKLTLRYRQRHAGLEVLGARVNVLFDLEGAVLSIQSTGLSALDGLQVMPLVGADQANSIARTAFELELGLTPGEVADAQLAIGSTLVNEELEARLVWELDARWSAPSTRPEGRSYWVDAHTGEVLRAAHTVHDLDVSGTVSTHMTPGTTADSGANPPINVPVKDLRVKSVMGDVFTDAAGNFNIVGTSGPLQVTAEFIGPWAHVDNDAGAEEVLLQQISGSGNTLVLNATPAAAVTSQANAFVGIGQLRDWVRQVDPTDATADFQAYARVNLNDVCNAYYDGVSVNFFAAGTTGGGTSCVNTGFNTVVAHEMGHWLNVLYGTGNGSDGMGEGNADVFAMYFYDSPIVGDGFFGAGTSIRTGLNNTLFCGDCCPGCHGGQVHKEGEAWMGAAWKIRARLNATNGNTAGDLIADSLFSGWMNGYDQTQIRSVIELQWLTLDDDNGYLDDGTPHFDDIDLGFRDQGFPGYDKPAVLFSDATILGDTVDEVGPYPVEVTAIAQSSAGIAGITLNYRVNDGNWITFGMVPFGGGIYRVDIPGQTSIAFVEYYLSATDANSTVVEFPESGAAEPLSFVVGSVNSLFFDDFEGVDDNGWTHASFGDTSNPHDDFRRGTPAGNAGDPSSAASGDNAWGNDLGEAPWNGAYQNTQHNWLRSPPIDCTFASNTQLRFKRWLRVQSSLNDSARIRVNGVEVFLNDSMGSTSDNSWQDITLDVSAAADGQPAVVVEFSLESDASGTRGGWNIDDVELRYVTPSPVAVGLAYCSGDGTGTACPCNNFGASGAGCANSSGAGASISGLGSTSVALDDLVVNSTDLVASQPALLFAGLNAVNSGAGNPFGDGLRCAGGSIVRLGVKSAGAAGGASWGPGLGSAGGWSSGDTRRLQVWYRDPSAGPCGSGFNLSTGLEVSFTQ